MKPLIFSPAMNVAYRAGRKCETRRVIRGLEFFGEEVGVVYGSYGHSGPGWYAYDADYPDEGSLFVKCPQGEVGQRVWIKEALTAGVTSCGVTACYLSDGQPVLVNGEPLPWRWKPRRLAAMYMPREACRATPKIISLKIERVQDIGINGLYDEGFQIASDLAAEYGGERVRLFAYEWYRDLWDSLHARPKPVYRTEKGRKILDRYESYPWDESSRDPREEIGRRPHICLPNPFVWVERLEWFAGAGNARHEP